jgi:hypothetical protein
MKTTLLNCSLLAALSVLTACGQPSSSSSSAAPTNGTQGSTPLVPTPSEDIKGFVFNGPNEDQEVVWLDAANGMLVLSAPLPTGFSINIPDTPIPDLPDAHAYGSINAAGVRTLNVAVPLRYVLRNVASIPAGALPNGDALPEMPNGQMPRTAFSITGGNGKTAYLYVGSDAVGVYFETNFDPKFSISFDVDTKTSQKVGVFALEAAKAPYKPGVFLGVSLPMALARSLDKFIR